MKPGDKKTLVLPARLLAASLSADEESLREAVLESMDTVVLLADSGNSRAIDGLSFDALPASTWMICPDQGILQRSLQPTPARQWAPLNEFARNGPPPHEAAAALAWWLRFSGRTPQDVIVLVEDDSQWLAADWASVLGAEAPVDLRLAAQRYAAKHSARVCCASEPGWWGWQQGVAWHGGSQLQNSQTPTRLGATPVSASQTFFRVWAPRRKKVAVDCAHSTNSRTQRFPLERDSDGYHTGHAPIGAGQEYRYALDTHLLRPDPASRFQPRTVHEHSLVTATTFPWTDRDWQGVPKRDLVIYETHLGAFSSSGDYRGAMERIPYLQQLGVTALELLPLAQAPGKWNWGYDGVSLFAPNNNYGSPEELKALVDACHRAGIAVLLDVVYNHLGPEGNYLNDFGPYFSKKHHTPWGGAFNFDGWMSDHVRRLIIDNAVYWLEEFHFDGLRLDAVHFMFDDRRPTILSEIRTATADFASRWGREIHLIAEANMFDEVLLAPSQAEHTYDAIWCDCLMHAIYSLGAPDLNLTYREFRGAEDIDEALRHGYLYEMPAADPEAGDRPQVTRTLLEHRVSRHDEGDLDYMTSLVIALQTHDSVGNHPHGKRLHQLTSVDYQRAAAALVLLHPSIPMLFMGEESSSESPFPFFADFGDPGLRQNVDRGRAREYPQHQWEGALAPSDPQAFWQSKCEGDGHGHPLTLAWYQQLLRLRKEGVATRWLVPKRMKIESDTAHGVFMMGYSIEGSEHLWVAARLAASEANDDDAAPWIVPHEGVVVLDSRQIDEVIRPSLQLYPNHALVIRGTSS